MLHFKCDKPIFGNKTTSDWQDGASFLTCTSIPRTSSLYEIKHLCRQYIHS